MYTYTQTQSKLLCWPSAIQFHTLKSSNTMLNASTIHSLDNDIDLFYDRRLFPGSSAADSPKIDPNDPVPPGYLLVCPQ